MPDRRAFLAGTAALAITPVSGWADAGQPHYLAAAKIADGTYHVHGLNADGQSLFSLPLPGRGHAAAAHPDRPEAVAFARRPGRFAIVIDCVSGQQIAELAVPEGRHVYGHGTFSADGNVLFTTENDYETGTGIIGLWDSSAGYRRMGEVPSGGIGPHDIALLPGSDTLVVANGGIDTHPDTGRLKLNVPTMVPNLSYLSADGALTEQVILDKDMRLNSIRHLAVGADGLVAFVMQWQGATADAPPLLGLHRRGTDPHLLRANAVDHHRMAGYGGSVALSGDGSEVAITSPEGGLVQRFATQSGDFSGAHLIEDVCGIATRADGFLITSGTGLVGPLSKISQGSAANLQLSWDNHVVRI